MARPPQDPARQRERAHRVLDAAAELIVRWGYDKTTIDDIAKQAGVAKGTIYLHWKTREQLFAALLRRERVETFEQIRRAEPETLRELVRVLVTGVLSRPIMRAVLLDDPEVLGKLTRMKRDRPKTDFTENFERYFLELGKHGAIRQDLPAGEQLAVLVSVIYGFLLTAQLTPESYRLSDDRLAELVADTAHRALDPGLPGSPDGARAVAEATRGYTEHAADIARRKLEESLEGAST